jgi:DNA replication and repair protein RecF
MDHELRQPGTNAARLLRLTLSNFRSYRAATLKVDDGPVVLVGPNGAGKTNVLEAISFLAPGRGLRRATLDEVAFSEGGGAWAVSAEVEGALGLATLGTGIEAPPGEEQASRKCRIDREPVASAAAFADHLRVVWLTPQMDPLFSGPASERRRFIDRLVLAVDPEHSGRVNALERALRSRNRLLEEARPDPHWLDAIEHETAEVAVAVAAGRAETVRRLQGALEVRKAWPRRSRGPRSHSMGGSRPCCSTTPRSRPRTAIARCYGRAGRGTPRQAARSPARTLPTSK